LVVTVRRESCATGEGDHGGEDALCVDVADTGTGIAPDILHRIFEPFFTTKPGGKGTGLGLAIAARIVDAHRGTIAVTRRREGGTIFTVRLPAAVADRPVSQSAEQVPVPQETAQ